MKGERRTPEKGSIKRGGFVGVVGREGGGKGTKKGGCLSFGTGGGRRMNGTNGVGRGGGVWLGKKSSVP